MRSTAIEALLIMIPLSSNTNCTDYSLVYYSIPYLVNPEIFDYSHCSHNNRYS